MAIVPEPLDIRRLICTNNGEKFGNLILKLIHIYWYEGHVYYKMLTILHELQ